MSARRTAVLGLIAAAIWLPADGRSSAVELPRLDLAARDAVAALTDLLPSSGRSADGRQLYQTNCASCHGGSQGGNASDYPPRHNAVGHTWHHGDCELLQFVRSGGVQMVTADPPSARKFAAPGIQMPTFRDRLTDDEIKSVLSFIKTLWKDDQRAAQRATTARVCGAS